MVFVVSFSFEVNAQEITAKEFINGKFIRFSTKGHPKSKEASFTMKYPSTWMAQEGDRPNMVQRFISGNKNGVAFALISTKSIPIDEPLTQNELQEVFSPEMLKKFVPDGGKFLNAKSTKIEGEPAGIVEYRLREERAGRGIDIQTLKLTFFQKRTLIFVSFSVAAPASSSGDLAKQYAALYPLFFQMMNSIVFDDKYN